MKPATPERLAWADWLKASASLTIVLHHLCFYGPMADEAKVLAPAVIDWMAQYGRLAVQVFLVLGGYFAARSLVHRLDRWRLLDQESRIRAAVDAAADRWVRLVIPLWVALVLAVLCAMWARAWMDHPSVGAPAQGWQMIVHLFLLQDVLGVEALSAGVWYVAIDLQLYVMALGLCATAAAYRRPSRVWVLLIVAGLVLSVLLWNRDSDWDSLGLYFWGSYGLGMLLALAHGGGAAANWARIGLMVAGLVWALALSVEFRLPLAMAGATAGAILVIQGLGAVWNPRAPQAVQWLSRISYSVFLVHFPLSLVVNALFQREWPGEPVWQAMGMGAAVVLSVAGGHLFHRCVEARATAIAAVLASVLRRLRGGLRFGGA